MEKINLTRLSLFASNFECDPPGTGLRKYRDSRDKRPDCIQVAIALIVTPEDLPPAYEVMPGNTKDLNILEIFLQKVEDQYVKSNRTWLMDRGIPTEETIERMRG